MKATNALSATWSLVLAGCLAAAPAPVVKAKPAAAGITSAVVCKGYENGQAEGAGTTFGPTDHKLHCVVKFSKISKLAVRIVWTIVNAKDAGGQVYKNVQVLDTKIPAQLMERAHGSVEVEHDWPVGKYKVDISVNGKPVRSLPFTIQ